MLLRPLRLRLKFTNLTILVASNKEQTNQKENEAPIAQGHSQGLGMFLAQLAGAYNTENKACEIVDHSISINGLTAELGYYRHRATLTCGCSLNGKEDWPAAS
jgi:hypothetical protein